MRRLLVFLFSLTLCQSQESEKNFIRKNTFSWPESLSELTLSSISPRCKEDIETWKKALFLFTEAFSKIYVGKNTTPQLFKQLKDNYYSVKQLDAFGRPPSGFLDLTLMGFGSYKECREVDFESPYGTNYCYLSAELPFYNNTLPLKNAVCMPKSCTDQDIVQLFRESIFSPLNYYSASCTTNTVEPSTYFWVFMSVLIFFSAWAILATIVDYVMESVYNRTYAKETNRILRVFLSFSFWTNGAAIMNISPPKQGHLRSLDSIRFISMSWVVSGHTLIEFMLADSKKPILSIADNVLSETFLNAFLSVDTFFLLSGLLVSYLFFKANPKEKMVKNPVTWILFYVHRYLRLTPPYILFLGFYVAFLPFLNGPWNISQGGLPLIQNTIQSCENTWWKNLLYINNYEPLTQCYAISWYLAVDTQLYVFAPIFLVALYFSSIVGGILLSLMGIGSIVATYVIMYQYDLVATLFTLGGREEGTRLHFADKLYEVPWVRCTPYLIGLWTGFLLAKAKGKQIKLHPIIISGCWAAAIAVALACVYGVSGYSKGTVVWSKFTRASYYNFSRIGWAVALAWVISANHLGWGGPVSSVMDHPLWQPLGRLSYCGYIVHYFVISYYFNLMDRPSHFISLWQTYVYYTIPITILSYVLAFFWSCLFEVPFLRLEKMLIDAIIKSKRPDSMLDGERKNGKDTLWVEDQTNARSDTDLSVDKQEKL